MGRGKSGSVGTKNAPKKAQKKPEEKQLVTDKDYENALEDAFNTLKQTNAAGKEFVPVHKLKDYMVQKYGSKNAGTFLNRKIENLYKKGLRLRPISRTADATPDQLKKSIPGFNETLFYVVKD